MEKMDLVYRTPSGETKQELEAMGVRIEDVLVDIRNELKVAYEAGEKVGIEKGYARGRTKCLEQHGLKAEVDEARLSPLFLKEKISGMKKTDSVAKEPETIAELRTEAWNQALSEVIELLDKEINKE